MSGEKILLIGTLNIENKLSIQNKWELRAMFEYSCRAVPFLLHIQSKRISFMSAHQYNHS